MQVVFKQAVCIKGKDYAKGAHNVPESVLVDKHFLKYVKAGLITESHVLPVKTPAQVTVEQDAFAEKLLAQSQATAKASLVKMAKEEDAKLEASKSQSEASIEDSAVEEKPADEAPEEPAFEKEKSKSKKGKK